MLIAPLLLTPLAAAPLQTSQPNLPPPELWMGTTHHAILRQGDVTGSINYRTNDSVVSEKWRYGASVRPSDTLSVKYVEFATAYWPTNVCAISAGQLIVSGKSKRPSGETVIELWSFENGGVVPPPQVQHDPVTGAATYHWIFPARTSIAEVYREATTGRNGVLNVFPNHGHSGSVLIEFFDSKDIYELNLQTQVCTKVVSATAAQGMLVETHLTSPYDTFWSADHPSRGYMYVFRHSFGTPQAQVETLVLQDTNRDGVLDTTYTTSDSAWTSTGLSQSSSYTTVFQH